MCCGTFFQLLVKNYLVLSTMKINKRTAQLIVEELREVINEHINFINKDGTIIYSSDAARIATFHAAGLLSIRDNKVVKVYRDDEYAGAKKGINMPINFNGEVIASIGITGDTASVSKYGAIIQKMTEILLKETYNQKIDKQKRERIKSYLEDLIAGNENELINNPLEDDNSKLEATKWKRIAKLAYADSHLKKASSTQAHATLPAAFEMNQVAYTKLICVGKNVDNVIDVELSDKIYRVLEKFFSNNCLYAVFFKEIIIYCYEAKSIKDFKVVLANCATEITRKTGYVFDFGISEEFYLLEQASSMYKQAQIALRWGHLANLQRHIFSYARFDIELLLSAVDKKTLNKYKQIILNNLLDKDDYAIYAKLIKAYVQCNGSLQACADKLFIHKNTVQYRLNKLAKLTGLNPQNTLDLIKLYLAFLINV